MNFLVYSSPNPPPPPPAPPPAGTPNAASTIVDAGNTQAAAAAAAAAAGVVSPFPPEITGADPANIILRSLTCIQNKNTLNLDGSVDNIPGVIDILRAMGGVVHSLYKNKLYAACRDTVNKSEGVIAIASAYQSFLWDKDKRSNIRLQEDNDTTDSTICLPKLHHGRDIKDFIAGGLDNLVGSLNPCWMNFPNLVEDLLDLNTVLTPPYINLDDVEFQPGVNNNLGRFLIFSWFITSIFGIKTKSKPSKILALGRTYLKLYVESYRSRFVQPPQPPQPPPQPPPPPPPPPPPQQLFGCVFTIPNTQLTQRAVNEGGVELFFMCNDPSILCLTYGSFNIKDALAKYIELQDGYGHEQGNEVVKKIQIDAAQQRNQFQVLGITYASNVFQDVILQQLLTRFSIIPKGKQFTITASNNMGILLRDLYTNLQTLQQVQPGVVQLQVQPGVVQLQVQPDSFATLCKNLVATLLPRVKELNIYTPGKHDKSKFENFPNINDVCTSQYFRTKWIIYLVSGILNIFNIDAKFTHSFMYKNMKLFILLLKYLINESEVQNLEAVIALSIVKPFEINITEDNLAKVKLLIDSEYPQLNTESCIAMITRTEEVATQVQQAEQQEKVVQNLEQKPVVRTEGDEQEYKSIIENEELNRTKSFDIARKISQADLKTSVSSIQELRGLTTLLTSKENDSPKKSEGVSFKKKVVKKQGGPGGVARGGGTIRTHNPHSPKKTNNHTRKNKYKRNNKNKKQKSSPKYRKVNPSSRSGSQSNRKKSKSKLPHKNVTFKRRRYNNK